MMFVAVLILTTMMTGSAAPNTTVTIDGQTLQFDVPPTIVEGRTLVRSGVFLRHWEPPLNGIMIHVL